MKAIDFRDKLERVEEEIIKTVKNILKKFEDNQIDFRDYDINCPCINSGAPEHDLHVVSSVHFYENGNSLHFSIDDQQCGYSTEEVPLDVLVDILSEIEDIEI